MEWEKATGAVVTILFFISAIIFKFYSLHRDVEENTKDISHNLGSIKELQAKVSETVLLTTEIKLLNMKLDNYLMQFAELMTTNNKRMERLEAEGDVHKSCFARNKTLNEFKDLFDIKK